MAIVSIIDMGAISVADSARPTLPRTESSRDMGPVLHRSKPGIAGGRS